MTPDSPDPSSPSVGWVALAALIILVAAVTLILLREQDGTDLLAAPTPTPTPTDPAPTPDAPPADTEALDSQVREIAETVERMREMAFEEVPDPRFLDDEEIAVRVDELLEEYTDEEADLDRRLLTALGAMDRDEDLRALYRDALSEQVAGLYDPETGDLIVVATPDGESLGPLARLTLVHELGHALLDQVIGLPDTDDDEIEGEEDATLASQAVVEGDATLIMLLYAQQELTSEEQFELLEEQQDAATELGALDDLPHYLRRQLMFPYEEGLAFVAEIQQREGWDAVNAAFEDPPATTIDVLDPERFRTQRTVAEVPQEPQEPGAGWQHATTRSLGAADLLFLFEAPGGDETSALDAPKELAMLWRGGEVALWTDGDATTVGLTLTGEDGLCDAVGTWYERAFPDATVEQGDGTSYTAERQDAHLECTGDEVRLGVAPDLETARTVAG